MPSGSAFQTPTAGPEIGTISPAAMAHLSCLAMQAQVDDRSFERVKVVLESSEATIAIVAQKPSHLPCAVVVIDIGSHLPECIPRFLKGL